MLNKYSRLDADIYQRILKPILFRLDAEKVHNGFSLFGQALGNIKPAYWLINHFYNTDNPKLHQKINGITYTSPVGLAAGFDYEARLTQITPALGFGFHTVGTITYSSYKGNPRPMLGRLPESKSLLVNKGFKNLGAAFTARKLKKLKFSIPVGISIGRTNNPSLNQAESIADIVNAITVFEKSEVKHAYYELNISCPNLFGNVTFYEPSKLEKLLSAVDTLKLKRPIYIKMPIEKTDKEVLAMLEVIARHTPSGVIFGNLQKDRNHPSLNPDEVRKYTRGYFSGKPTFERSNQLIALAYKHYKKRFIIIGCGGIFSAEDAYLKLTLGASLVQLITGMIYQGPQLIKEINIGLLSVMHEAGVKHISDIIGTKEEI